MNKIFTLKTILTTLISTSIASSLIGLRTTQAPPTLGGVASLPVRANEDNWVNESSNSELILSQNFDGYGNRPTYAEPTDSFKTLVGITGLAVGTGIIGWHLTKAYKPSLVNSIPTINNDRASLLDRISPKLRKELLRLVHNQQTANRLLSGTLISHPHRSPNWIAEKVIYDLKRDRA